MEKNIGKTDKGIRVLIGVIIIVAGAYFNSVWGILGMIPIVTSQMGVCPIYSLLHIHTMSETEKKKRY
jgi:hypothetical protein